MLSNEKFKIIYLGKDLYTSKGDLNQYLKNIPNNKFSRTKVAITDNNCTKTVEDLSLRSSWTFDETIYIYNEEVVNLSENELKFKLLKYEKGDFFKLHKDHMGNHTCLIVGGTSLYPKYKRTEIKVDNYEIEDCNEETSYEDQNTFPSDIFKEEDDDDDY